MRHMYFNNLNCHLCHGWYIFIFLFSYYSHKSPIASRPYVNFVHELCFLDWQITDIHHSLLELNWTWCYYCNVQSRYSFRVGCWFNSVFFQWFFHSYWWYSSIYLLNLMQIVYFELVLMPSVFWWGCTIFVAILSIDSLQLFLILSFIFDWHISLSKLVLIYSMT